MTSYPQPPVSALEKAYALIALLLMVGAFTPILASPTDTTAVSQFQQGSFKFQLISGVVYLGAIVFLLPFKHIVVEKISGNGLLFSFIGLILLSSFWAQDPSVSFRRSIALFGTSCLGLYLAIRFSPDALMKLLALAFIIMVVESTFLALMMPSIGVHGYQDGFPGAWRGALGFKNDFGRVMVLATMVFWTLSNRSSRSGYVYLGFFVLSAFLVYQSQSRSAWVVIACLVCLVPALAYIQRGGRDFIARILIVITLTATTLILLLLPNIDQLLLLIDRDVTLTGRTHIWNAAINIGIERPWLGHGYRSFWSDSVQGFLILAGHGHNSYLDVWLELGFVGLGLFVATFLVGIGNAVRHLKRSDSPIAVWNILFLAYMLLYGTVAKTFPEHSSIAWVLFVTTLVYLSSPTSRQPQAIVAPVRSG